MINRVVFSSKFNEVKTDFYTFQKTSSFKSCKSKIFNQHNAMKRVLLFSFLLISFLGWGQTQIFVLDFETPGGYTTSMAEQTDGSNDYFTRTNGTDISAIYNSPQGLYFFAAQDLDADGMSSPATLSIDDINISGYTNLELRVYLAEDDDGLNEDWDASDYLHIDYDIDNSGTFSNGVWVENDGSGFNSAPYIDTDYDGDGDGAEITDTFTQFTKNITGTGSLLDIKITFGGLTSSDEDIAIDHIEIWGIAAGPTITVSPSSLTGFTYVEGSGPSAEQSFTVEGSNLTDDITVTPPANWEISTTSGGPYQTSAITLTQSGGTVASTTIYTRMVAGLSQAGSPYSGNISCTTPDGNGGTVTENVAVDGTVTYSNQSDIVANAGFSYSVNIPYVNFQDDPITNTSGSVGVFKFDIRDGGGSADADNKGTELTDITFSVGATHGSYIRSAALFAGNAMKANQPTIDTNAGTISFTNLSGADFTAPDDGVKSFTLRVSFATTVTDNEQLQFTITSATANSNGSVFATADAGGAQSSVTGDKNRIEVVADRLAFGQQPTNTNTNATMIPPVTVKGVDVYGNLDLDFIGNISISSSGTMNNDPITNAAVSGVATFDNIVHSAPGTGLTLTASHSGFASVTSNTFDILDFVYEAGDFRPKFDTDFSYNGQWEYYDGSSWVEVPDGKAPQNTTVTINRIIIDKAVTAGGSSSHNYNCDIIVQNGGTLTFNDDDPTPDAEFLSSDNTLEVLDGGKIIIQGDIDLASSTHFILRSGAYMVIDQPSMVNNHPMWDGIELFEGGSTVEIKDWNWSASPTVRSLINVVTTISDNANGYKFGKIYFNPTNMTNNWTIVGGPVNVKVTENDFQINNASSHYVSVMSNKTAGISATFGGDLVIDDGPFAFGSSYSSDNFDQTIIIKGDLLVGSDDDLYLHKTFNGTPTITAGNGQIKIEGNIEIWQMGSNIVTSDVDTKQILLTGDNVHTIFIERNCINTPLIVEGGETAELINSDLKLAGHSSVTIQNNATFNFGFDGNTALNVINVGGAANKFIQQGGAYLYITSPKGIWDASSEGNVQSFSASNTTYTQTNSIYHYVGKSNQETGDAFTSGSTSKTIICELENDTYELRVTSTTGTSSLLEIRKGIVVNTEANHIYGSGDLTISGGGLRTSILATTGNVPILSGTFNITGGFIELNAAGDQTLKGSNDYRDLIFSNSGLKTVSSGIPNIDGTITVKDNAVLDVENHTMGGVNTNITMTDNSEYKTAGIGVKPDAQGTYNLGVGTKMTFYNNNSTLQRIRLFRDYYDIDVIGTNVGTQALTTPLRIQSGGTFTVKSGATFKLINTAGFTGSTETAISNANNPNIILENGSTIEYNGANQIITPFNYKNLAISGTDIKTLGHATNVIVEENLNVKASELLIENNKGMTIHGDITNTGSIVVEHSGNLVQTSESPNISNGNYTLNKTASHLVHYYDYVYWSSPLNSTQMTMGDLVNNAWAYYYFDPSIQDPSQNPDPGWTALTSSDTFVPAKGYAVSAPVGFTGGNLNVSFSTTSEKFNTGNIQIPIIINGTGAQDDDDWNLVGNPYPSAIDFNLLAQDNTSITGAYYAWTNCAGLDANGHHQPAGYTVYSAGSGGVAACSGTGISTGRYINSAQGFFVEGNTSGNLTFKNAYRVVDHNNNFIGRETPKDRVWIDLTNDSGSSFSQILVGFFEGATDGKDRLFDAHAIGGLSTALYTINNGEKFVIQGFSPWNGLERVVPLGLKINSDGEYIIRINRLEGVLETVDIYLHDLRNDSYYNLSTSEFRTYLTTGNYENDFELVFSPRTMETNQEDLPSFFIGNSESTYKIHSDTPVHHVQIYDISGRLIFEIKNDISQNDLTFSLRNYPSGTYLVKIYWNNGKNTLEKIIR